MLVVSSKRNFYWLVFFWCAYAFSQEHLITFSHMPSADDYQHVNTLACLPCSLHTVEMISDSSFSHKEFTFLTRLQPGIILTAELLLSAIEFLRRKSKVSTIFCKINIDEITGEADLVIYLQGFWTFKGIEFQGMIRHRDRYNHLYGFDPGERFASDKHKLGIDRIHQALKDDGYLNAEIYDYFLYDTDHKEIFVRVALDYGHQFLIRDMVIESDESVDVRQIQHHLIMDYRYKAYTKNHVLDGARSVQDFLHMKGWSLALVHCIERVDYNDALVHITYKVTVGNGLRVRFAGNSFFSSADLYHHISAFGKSLDEVPDELIIQELQEAYYRKGYWSVNISFNRHASEKTFTIQEGERSTIVEVQAEGCAVFSADRLQQFFSRVFKHSFFDDAVQEQCVQSLLHAYKEKGYLDARCVRISYEVIAQNRYRMKIHLDEGRQCFYQKITIPRYEVLESDPFFQSMIDQPFNEESLKKQQAWLTAHVQEKGFLYAKIIPHTTQRDGHVMLEWEVQGDSPVFFGKPIVIGTTSLPFEYLLRELTFKEGESWSQDKLTESLQRLRKLGIFESIHLYPADIALKESHKNVIIKIREDSPFELRTRLGFQQVSRTFGAFHHGTTYKIGGTFVYKNPFKDAGRLAVDVDVTKYYRNVSASYFKPWIFNRPIALNLKAYNNKYIQPVYIGSNKPLYRALQEGLLCSFTKSSAAFDNGFTIGFEVMETNDLSVKIARAIDFEPRLISKKVPYIFAEQSFIANFLDNSLNPKRGTLSVLSCKAMVPLRREVVAFFRILVEQSCFYSCASSTFGLRVRFGHIFNQNFEEVMPPERFYLGGQNSIRSYEPNMAPPLGSYIDKKEKRQLVPQGGKSMLNCNVEWRFPLLGGLSGALFQDCGVLGQHSLYQAVRGGKIVAGTGFGLRFATLVGPIRFDMAFKWRRFDPLEGKYAWFITLGQAF